MVFEYLRAAAMQSSCISIPTPDTETNIVDCDASEEAAGAVLMQRMEEWDRK